jgi:hypothetical protein
MPMATRVVFISNLLLETLPPALPEAAEAKKPQPRRVTASSGKPHQKEDSTPHRGTCWRYLP